MASPLEAAQAAIAQLDAKIEGQESLVTNRQAELLTARGLLRALKQERARWQRAAIVLKQARA